MLLQSYKSFNSFSVRWELKNQSIVLTVLDVKSFEGTWQQISPTYIDCVTSTMETAS